MASLTTVSHARHVIVRHHACPHTLRPSHLLLPCLHRQLRPCLRRSKTSARHIVSASAEEFEEGELVKGVKAGDRLKVKESRIVYHSPKHKDGLDLKGMEGECIEVIEKYQGSKMSANLPYKTVFMIPKDDGKDQKLVAHLAAGEFDKV